MVAVKSGSLPAKADAGPNSAKHGLLARAWKADSGAVLRRLPQTLRQASFPVLFMGCGRDFACIEQEHISQFPRTGTRRGSLTDAKCTCVDS